MRSFLTVLFSGFVSFGVSFALVYAASEWMPCFDDAGSCRAGEAYGVVGTIVYAPVSMLLFGFTMWRARSERALAIVMAVLLAPIVVILAIGVLLTGFHFNLARDGQGILQFYLPVALIVAVQWALLRAYIRRTIRA